MWRPATLTRASHPPLAAFLAAALGVAAAGCRPAGARPPDIILITLDTTRADRLGAYGSARGLTPNLDALARRGVRFTQAYSHAPLTLPAHASLLTGRIPPRHGVRDNGGQALPVAIPTLAESLAAAGWHTGAFVSASVLERRFGLGRGFQLYRDDLGDAEGIAAIRAPVTVARVLEWLRSPDDRPRFAWVHLFDPHDPYEPAEPFASRHPGDPYDAEIEAMDDAVGRLLTGVAGRGRPAIVAAVADHGEALGEHGEPTHAYFIYDATQNVPFLLSWPGRVPEGRAVDGVVRGVDLMPTLLDLVGVAAPAGLDGVSLVKLVDGVPEEGRAAYLESFSPRLWWGASELVGLREGRWLYIRSPRSELYDVAADPGETRNLAASLPAEVRRLDARLGPTIALSVPTPRQGDERLRALGYLSGPPPSPDAVLPDAKDNADLLGAFASAKSLAENGCVDDALAEYRQLLTRHPRSAVVRTALAEALLAKGNGGAAEAVYRGLALEFPGWPGYPLARAEALMASGRAHEAAALLAALDRDEPRLAGVPERLAAALLASGRATEGDAVLRAAGARGSGTARVRLAARLMQSARAPEAAALLEQALRDGLRPRDARDAAAILAEAGGARLDAGDPEGAVRAYRSAIRAGVATEEAFANLALALVRQGRDDEAAAALREGLRQLPRSTLLAERLDELGD